MEKLFHLKENGTNVKTEVMAGITTFLAMAYILAVNPSMLGDAGMNSQGVFMATALAAAVATIVMALLANYPIALASGMGLNAYFAYTICLGELADQANPWQIALTAILVEGIIFIILSAFKFRETLVNCIPENLKYGITTGIGLFITFIGLQNAGIAAADASTKVALGDIAQPQVALALIGVIIIGLMLYFNVKGAILWGILITWGLGIIAQFTGWYAVNPEAGVYSLLPSGSFLPNFAALGDTAFKFDFSFMLNNTVEFAVIVFAFLFVDLFDTVGTLIGVAAKGNMLDKDGKLPRVGRALMADAIGTVAGACLHRHQLCGKLRRRGRGRPHGPHLSHHGRDVHPLAVPVARVRRHPQLRHCSGTHHRGPVHDVQRAEGEVRGRYGRRAGRFCGHHHDAVHLFHRQRHHVRHPDMDVPEDLPRQGQGHPPRDVGRVRAVRAAHRHALLLKFRHFSPRLCAGAFFVHYSPFACSLHAPIC